jgi:hypothetical protein
MDLRESLKNYDKDKEFVLSILIPYAMNTTGALLSNTLACLSNKKQIQANELLKQKIQTKHSKRKQSIWLAANKVNNYLKKPIQNIDKFKESLKEYL